MRISKNKKGLSLVEMIVTISIMIILLGVLSLFIIRTFSINGYLIEQGLNLSVLQTSLRSFSANLREARQAEDGSYLLSKCDEYSMAFYADIDNDSFAEKLTYSLLGGYLELEIIEPDLTQNPPSYLSGSSSVRTIGGGVVNKTLAMPLFYYYQEDGETPLTGEFNFNEVELVRIRVYANIDINQAPDSMMIETMVRPRNIP